MKTNNNEMQMASSVLVSNLRKIIDNAQVRVA